MIDGLCQRWSCPPSVVLAEDASAYQMVKIIAMGRREEVEHDGGQHG